MKNLNYHRIVHLFHDDVNHPTNGTYMSKEQTELIFMAPLHCIEICTQLNEEDINRIKDFIEKYKSYTIEGITTGITQNRPHGIGLITMERNNKKYNIFCNSGHGCNFHKSKMSVNESGELGDIPENLCFPFYIIDNNIDKSKLYTKDVYNRIIDPTVKELYEDIITTKNLLWTLTQPYYLTYPNQKSGSCTTRAFYLPLLFIFLEDLIFKPSSQYEYTQRLKLWKNFNKFLADYWNNYIIFFNEVISEISFVAYINKSGKRY